MAITRIAVNIILQLIIIIMLVIFMFSMFGIRKGDWKFW